MFDRGVAGIREPSAIVGGTVWISRNSKEKAVYIGLGTVVIVIIIVLVVMALRRR